MYYELWIVLQLVQFLTPATSLLGVLTLAYKNGPLSHSLRFAGKASGTQNHDLAQ